MTDLSVPWLRSGMGKTPAEGGCILQVIDWIDRTRWTDNPPCVHPVLARVAIRVNDALPDGERQKLLDLAPRLMGTASDDKQLAVRLAVFCGRRVLHIFEQRRPGHDRPRRALEAAERWADEPSDANRELVRSECIHPPVYANAAAAAAHRAAAAAYAAASSADAASYATDAAAAAYAAASSAAASSAAASYGYALLVALLDEYDRLTGRGSVQPVDLSPAAQAMAGAA